MTVDLEPQRRLSPVGSRESSPTECALRVHIDGPMGQTSPFLAGTRVKRHLTAHWQLDTRSPGHEYMTSSRHLLSSH